MISGKSTGYGSEETIGLSVSIILHLLFLIALFALRDRQFPTPTVIDVTVEFPAPKRPPKQIVSPSEQKSAKPPENTNRLSDEDSIAMKEQIKRGDNGGTPGKQSENPGPPSPPKPESKAVQQPPQKQAEPPKEPPKEKPAPVVQQPPPPKAPPVKHLALKDLKLDNATLAERYAAQPQKQKEQSDPLQPKQTSLSSYAAFSRPPGSGAAFLGTAGISDHLPNLPDGDITLLNAKANTYAGFVRRVAVQVFAQLRTQGWERLSRSEIAQLHDFTTVEAVLSPDGKFLTMNLLDGSGSTSFDGVVKLSVKSGAQDPNPPEGARAADGKIHFIFKARSWASATVSPRSGMPVERRWILLATGLE